MIGFDINSCGTAAGITNEERIFQVRSIANIYIEVFEQLLPHSSPRLPVMVSGSSSIKGNGEVQLIKDRSDFSFEAQEASLITFDGLWILLNADAPLVA